MNNPLRINLFFLLFSYFCIVSLSALAQENVTEKITSLKKEGYNTYIESTGLYLQDHQSSLGNGLYHGAKRGQIASLIRGIQDQAQWAAQSTLIKRLLLTQADTSILENDIPFSEESDLLAIRLKALLALGLQNQAFRLYSELDNTNTHNALHYYGVLSMLMSGEKALACVEIKTLFPDCNFIGVLSLKHNVRIIPPIGPAQILFPSFILVPIIYILAVITPTIFIAKSFNLIIIV